MDDMPIMPTTLLDHLRQQAEALRKSQGKGGRPRGKPGGAQEAAAPPGYCCLVEEDRTFFAVLVQPAEVGAPLVPGDGSLPRIVQAESAFRDAFVGVWNRIPRGDRDLLLRY